MINQGGATMQYTSIVKNLLGLRPSGKGMYITSGLWGSQCLAEARRHAPADKIIEVTNLYGSNCSQLTDPTTWNIHNDASYLHLTINETVHGFEITEENFPWHLFSKDVTVIGDMSSNIGTRKINWDRFGVVYAGAQKNLGPAGSTVMIVRKDLIGKQAPDTPCLCDWQLFEKSPGKYYNTPPVWAVYVMGLNVAHMNKQGGLAVYDREADVKSKMLYDLIDNSDGYYVNKTQKEFRSRMNITFRIPGDTSLEKKFMDDAKKYRIINIAGHATNPGIRISVYNAMPVAGPLFLLQFMEKFKRENPIASPQARL